MKAMISGHTDPAIPIHKTTTGCFFPEEPVEGLEGPASDMLFSVA